MKKFKTYTSSNGVKMVRGKNFDWEKYGKTIFSISLSGEDYFLTHEFWYETESKTLNIGKEEISFYCETLEDAENLVLLCVKGTESLEIPPLYKHKNKGSKK